MRKLFTLIFCSLALLMQAQNAKLRMCVLSDTHLMAPELLKQDGKAFQNYLVNDRKLLKESPELLDTAFARVRMARPQVLLITGDLTKDGERVSHELLLKRYIDPLRQQGVRVFVVPGNHDVRNPHAVEFCGEKTVRTRTVSREDFASIYRNCGYGDALACDTASLSYMAQLAPGLRLLALDACKYDENSFEKNICVTSGRLKAATWQFIEAQMAKARKEGQKVICMMHHGVAPHFRMEDVILSEYLVDDFERVARRLSELGIKVVFTGHLHSQDIAREGDLVDVETGSTVSFPHPYRIVDLDGNRMHIQTGHITSIASLPGAALMQKSRHFAESSAAHMVDGMIPSGTPAEAKVALEKLAAAAYVLHLGGDEQAPKEYWQGLKMMVGVASQKNPQLAQLMGLVGKYMAEDILPADNNTELEY